ncbi:flagellar hook-basal body complex protein FliE [Paenibacillus larvae]|uniref:Flagellar hook-basal body complex protein FliE n=4 Tax=Paenibacillus larvae TaxID=1464 RepID=V9W740_9BACL|nr:flagellar hook-basal body complex protein FliE [Paenibacillus larvae]AHD05963.1 flagellar hook-basal body complex protein FliE [Paenibacillus larvae subsp. larvae DSM 25430]AQR76595.1 flagellar hook-basal body protein FliE [Paenibacillus larvae subsp. larvae]AQT83646.1 flagellar hook-basal body complex protein FliE [Paenibacillus larvae subsp. pulvifaciens]AQZ48788.1 flagellar hook-basal body complex protein FliE [Paenibacillus larvae subsp. pulvifaciens]ARF69912.1 flagellar hook-basal body
MIQGVDTIYTPWVKQVQDVQDKTNPAGAAQATEKFGSFLLDAIDDLNKQQLSVDDMNQKFVKGEITDIHQLMVASEKASLGLELAVQVRNKAIEAYQDIMRIQI